MQTLNDETIGDYFVWTLYKNDYTGVDLFKVARSMSGDDYTITPNADMSELQEFVSTQTEDMWTSV
jgi:hypothetical protein